MTLLEFIAICLSWFCAGIAVKRCIDECRKRNTKEKTIEGWVARDKNGLLHLYCEPPRRGDTIWFPVNELYMAIDQSLFPSVIWESEPKKVKITIEEE